LKFARFQVIHLEYEHANNVDAVSNMGSQDRAHAESSHLRSKVDLKTQKEQLKTDLRREEEEYEEAIKKLETTQQKGIVKQRDEFELNHKMLHAKYEQRLKVLIMDLVCDHLKYGLKLIVIVHSFAFLSLVL